MLYVNNPEARTIIIEQSRRDNGMDAATEPIVTPATVPAPPSRTRSRLGYRVRPVATR